MVIPLRKIISKLFIIAISSAIFAAAVGGSNSSLPDIKVELDTERSLLLHVTLWFRAEKPVTFAKYRLPWGNRNSMLFVPVNTDGQCIGDQLLTIDDPSFEKVSLNPNESISGDLDLHRFVPELQEALKKSNVHLFWAYKAPDELNIAHWSGGWILISQQK